MIATSLSGLAVTASLAMSLVPTAPAAAPPRSSGWHVLPSARPDAALGVTFELGTCFWDPPPAGMFPMRLQVRNDGTRDRAWTLAFQATSGYHRFGTTYSTTHLVSIPAGATRTFELSVPVRAAPPSAGLASSLQVTFDGPRTPFEPVSLYSNNYYLHSGAGHTAHSPWIGLSETLATAHWESTKALLATRDSLLMVGSRFHPGCLPEDWRAYSGFAAFAMTGDEWRDLAPGPKLALERWVSRGGRLWLADGRAGEKRPLAFGRIEGLPSPEEIGAATLADAIVGVRGVAEDYEAWSLAGQMGTPPLPRGLMFAFILAFAFVVGPVNLFGFCRGGQRHRVFWTTPLISAVAVLGLAAVIVFRDGTGGDGHRLTVVGLVPDRHEEVVLQEQIARTGLLLSARFSTAEPVWLEPLEMTDRAGSRTPELRREGDLFTGSWFTSRALQGQWIELVRPSRARFDVEHRPGWPPRLVSTLPDTLDDVYLVDARRRVWHAAGVAPGRARDLAPADEAALDRWRQKIGASYGPRLRNLAAVAPPVVLAAAARSEAAVATLGSIQWKDHETLYVQRLPH